VEDETHVRLDLDSLSSAAGRLGPHGSPGGRPSKVTRVSSEQQEHGEGGSSDPREHLDSCSDDRLHLRQPRLWRSTRERDEDNSVSLIRAR
jgi:hypothetical protein